MTVKWGRTEFWRLRLAEFQALANVQDQINSKIDAAGREGAKRRGR